MITVASSASSAPMIRFTMERSGLTVSSGMRRMPTSSWSGRSVRLPSGNRFRAFMLAGVERHSRPEDSRTEYPAAAWNDEFMAPSQRSAHFLAGVLTLGGLMHFVKPKAYDAQIPKQLPGS